MHKEKVTEERFVKFFKETQLEQLKNEMDFIEECTYTSDIDRKSNIRIIVALMNKEYFNRYVFLLLSRLRITLKYHMKYCDFVDDYLYTVMDKFVFQYVRTGIFDYRSLFELSNIYELSNEQLDRLNVATILGGIKQEDLHNICKECTPLGLVRK